MTWIQYDGTTGELRRGLVALNRTQLTWRLQTKAHHYIDQLEAARCDGSWDTVPELVRKVRKHASDRKCMPPAVALQIRRRGPC